MNLKRQQGFSIIELLIAVTLGLILTVGLISVFINSKQGYRVQESRSRMQENGRFALDYLTRAARLADFWGSVPPGQIRIDSPAPFTGGCGLQLQSGSYANLTDGIRGYDGAAAAPTDLASCISNFVPQSDGMVIRYGDPDLVVSKQASTAATTAALLAAAADNGSAFVRVLAGRSATIFNALNGTAMNNALNTAPFKEDAIAPALPPPPGALINYRYRAELYYLRMSDAADGPVTPSLYYSRNVTSGSNSSTLATALVDGIEMMQLEYGLDTNGDQLADRYMAASAIAAGNWGQVVAVRVNLIVRGDTLDNFTDSSSYNMAGGYTYTPASADQKYQRMQLVKEVQLRNRTKPR